MGRLTVPAQLWKRIPAAAAILLLACQMAVPWTANHFVTQDGPSHLYGATIARELVFNHRHSPYSRVYTIQRTLLPNWMATVALAGSGAIVGTDHAEQLFASLTILLGFLGLCYASRALAPNQSPLTPVLNFLLQTWFLWAGFYNFYLGMVLLPFVIGFQIRSAGRLTWTRVAAMSAALVVLYFTHLIAVGIAIMTLLVLSFWTSIAAPFITGIRQPRGLREFAMLLLAVLPATLLIGAYLYGAPATGPDSSPNIASILKDFPQFVFETASGSWGRQAWLWPFMLGYIVLGTLLMTGKEWTSPRGGLVIASCIAFAAYLLVPDQGLGGGLVIIRFAWGVFLLGWLATSSSSRLRMLRVPVALYVALFLTVNVIESAAATRATSRAADPYLAAANQIADNSSFVRLRYPAPAAVSRYGFTGTGRDPFFHLDARVAARKHALDLSDYEPLTELFPVAFKKKPHGQRYELWSFEGPDANTLKLLQWIRDTFPVPVDYVLLFGDEYSPAAAQAGMPPVRAYLDSNMNLVATSPDHLLRVYRRNGFLPAQF